MEQITFTFPTMLSAEKCRSLWTVALKAKSLDGEFWDIGCHSGGSAAVMRFAAPDRPVRMFDSFEGLPAGDKDAGRFAVPFQEIMLLLGPVHLGWVPKTFAGLENTKISLAHVDLDLYESTRDALSFIGPRIVKGGFIIVDDYGSEGWNGVRKAVDEFLTEEFIVSNDVSEQITLERK